MTQTQTITTTAHPLAARVLTPDALEFLTALEARFGTRRRHLLDARQERQTRLDAGETPDFLAATRGVREGQWRINPLPQDLQDRRVEITGPVDRKMIINALNSGANVFMADFEDASSPTWDNCVQGQVNLQDAVRRTITLDAGGKTYRLNDQVATLIVRPRGLHLDEKHATLGGQPVSGSLFDFGLYFFHNARELLARGSGPYVYLPKLEGHLEARWWNDVFEYAQDALGIPRGTIKATVLIETILAAFEMDEILYELRAHSAGLNCGRWDYIFSYIKKFRSDPGRLLPDRAQVTMGTPMMLAYSKLAVQTCHKRGAPAIGGMSAFIPVKNDRAANERAFAQVRADKEREATNGHDGTWVAHPGMVALAREVFDRLMPEPNQIGSGKQADLTVTALDLLTPPEGSVTAAGVNTNVDVSLQYLAAWLDGRGAVPIHNLMEDAATAEISRAQLWQWARYDVRTDDGTPITPDGLTRLVDQHLARLQAEQPERAARLAEAAELLKPLITSDTFEEFLTLPGYARLQ
ncbi:malate synthase A [Deinococcus maricopensis]|uniref:malate synthase n=1 Tax=Deinococcus maricopensis (strain DSM 21211 / LMG 22137 / NRRL B-23946 / LB-34) TaxID=709986 RepID=E8U775_DEIML|nr:malate synthase A [Deinococcus maricopensis]ADV66914.1 malate synthase A [Deinococcus maricopensis DSM 21211]